MKDIFSAFKDSAAELNGSNDTLKHQVLFLLELDEYILLSFSGMKQHDFTCILLQFPPDRFGGPLFSYRIT